MTWNPNTVFTTPAGRRRFDRRIRAARARYVQVATARPHDAACNENCSHRDHFSHEERARDVKKAERHLLDLEALSARLKVVECAETPELVQLGTRVTLEDLETGHLRVLEIAGFEDGAPEQGRVSYTTPLAQALLGLAVGDDVELPDGSEAELVGIEVA